MKIIIQKVKDSSVYVDGQRHNSIRNGFVLLVGIEKQDTIVDLEKAANKIVNLRVFEDENGKLNKSIKDIRGEILSISQFTLAADIRKGNRPSFINAMDASEAVLLFEKFNDLLRSKGIEIKTGVFQTHMNVHINNDGPVTIILQTKNGKILSV